MKTKEIRCSFFNNNEYNVNPDGQVYPCCFFANTIYVAKQFGYPKKGTIDPRNTDQESIQNGLQNSEAIATGVEDRNLMYKTYIENEDEYNLDNKSILQILNSDWYNELEELREDWNTAPHVCKKHCTVER